MMTINPGEIGYDTPIWQLTSEQLFRLLDEWKKQNVPPGEAAPAVALKGRRTVNSIKALCDILGTSRYTIYRMKRLGLLDEAISQFGRWQVIDVDKVLDIFRLSNRRHLQRTAARAQQRLDESDK
jgi:hypothetical protein